MEDFMTAIDAYLGAAGQAVALLRKPEVAAAWEQPSALAEATAGGVTDHHAYQIFSVRSALEGPASDEAPIPLLEHYAHAVWIGAPLGGRASWHPGGVSRPRERSRCGGAPTPRSLSSRRNCRAFRRPGCVPPQTGWALSLGDFLTTRMMELAVHMDDLAVSVGLATQELPDAAFDPVLVLLARLAARRHGQGRCCEPWPERNESRRRSTRSDLSRERASRGATQPSREGTPAVVTELALC